MTCLMYVIMSVVSLGFWALLIAALGGWPTLFLCLILVSIPLIWSINTPYQVWKQKMRMSLIDEKFGHNLEHLLFDYPFEVDWAFNIKTGPYYA